MALGATPRRQTWQWRDRAIAYRQMGTRGPAVLLVHGFGASLGHWRKNQPVLGASCRCFAIDLLGFGASAKPEPSAALGYTFETWAAQIADFCREVIGEPAYLIGNSIGCIAAMQAAVAYQEWVRGIAALNISLRLLHERKRDRLSWIERFGAPLVQKALQNRALGRLFFGAVARPRAVRNVLLQAYRRPEAVTDELVEILLEPARDPGAVGVFVAFTSYSQGPLAEDLLPQLRCPTIILWGEEDPWEPLALGRAFGEFPTVDRFIVLPGLGHCPQDEAPEVVNPILLDWLATCEAATREPQI